MHIDLDRAGRLHGVHYESRTVIGGQGPQRIQVMAESGHVADMGNAYRDGLVVDRRGQVVDMDRSVAGGHEAAFDRVPPGEHPRIHRGGIGESIEDHVGTGESVEYLHRQVGTGPGAVGDHHLVGIRPDQRGEQALYPAVLLVEPVVAIVGVVCDLVGETGDGIPRVDRRRRQTAAEQVSPLGQHREEPPNLLLVHIPILMSPLYARDP